MEARMTYVDWEIKGTKISACNCNYGCPCQFDAPPTYDKCEGVEVLDIEEGYFGDIDLGGIRVLLLAGWPGAIHEGDGVGQVIIDQNTSEDQREALYKIVSGEEQEPTTVFSIYASTMHEDYASLVKPIEIRHNLEARTAACFVAGIVELEVQPMRNAVTGEPSYARVVLPGGFEFNEAEMASSTFAGLGDWKFDYKDRAAIFSRFAYGPQGILN
jgi:hypothetical protein